MEQNDQEIVRILYNDNFIDDELTMLTVMTTIMMTSPPFLLNFSFIIGNSFTFLMMKLWRPTIL
jgi:hypothetical protein